MRCLLSNFICLHCCCNLWLCHTLSMKIQLPPSVIIKKDLEHEWSKKAENIIKKVCTSYTVFTNTEKETDLWKYQSCKKEKEQEKTRKSRCNVKNSSRKDHKHIHGSFLKNKTWTITPQIKLRLKEPLPHLWSLAKAILQSSSPHHGHRRPLWPDRYHPRRQQEEEKSSEGCLLFHDKEVGR